MIAPGCRTLIEAIEEVEYSAEDFIVAEDNHVLVTADGWVKRQKEINPETTRLREGDRIPDARNVTYATVLRFDRVAEARTEWKNVRARLERLRDLAAALGLLGGEADRPAPLSIPEPPRFTVAVRIGVGTTST